GRALGEPRTFLCGRRRGHAPHPRRTRAEEGRSGSRWALHPARTRPHPAPEVPGAERLIALDEALDRLAAVEPRAAEVVKLRYFAGLTVPEAAEALGISARTADTD